MFFIAKISSEFWRFNIMVRYYGSKLILNMIAIVDVIRYVGIVEERIKIAGFWRLINERQVILMYV